MFLRLSCFGVTFTFCYWLKETYRFFTSLLLRPKPSFFRACPCRVVKFWIQYLPSTLSWPYTRTAFFNLFTIEEPPLKKMYILGHPLRKKQFYWWPVKRMPPLQWRSKCHSYRQQKIIVVMLLFLPSDVDPGIMQVPLCWRSISHTSRNPYQQLKELLETPWGTLRFHEKLVENGCTRKS